MVLFCSVLSSPPILKISDHCYLIYPYIQLDKTMYTTYIR